MDNQAKSPNEQVVCFGPHDGLVGITAMPAESDTRSNVGVIFINSGLVHRIGPNRIYVPLTRKMATLGFQCLRFDFSGIGDSISYATHMGYGERYVKEVSMAMDMMGKCFGLHQFIIVGSCSGAVYAIRSALADERIVGIIPINISSTSSVISILRRYFFQSARWKKLFLSQLNLNSIKHNLRNAYEPHKSVWNENDDVYHPGNLEQLVNEINTLTERQVRILFVSSDGDQSLDLLRVLFKKVNESDYLSGAVNKRGGHSLFPAEHQKALMEMVMHWCQQFFSETVPSYQHQAFDKSSFHFLKNIIWKPNEEDY